MAQRSCSWCGSPISPLARADARWCSGRCRVAAHRSGVPADLRGRDQWVRFDQAKRPVRVDGSGLASVTAPGSWSTWGDARRAEVGMGMGFVLTDSDSVCCVDIDRCLVDGELVPWAAQLLEDCPETWIEVSPSGCGLHVWGVGQVGQGRSVPVGGGRVEVYDRGRYITVTGRRFAGAPAVLADLSGWLEVLPGA